MSNISIIIGGDIVPTKTNEDLFINGDVDALISNDIVKILGNSDYNIFNLEVPITDLNTPIIKCGPNLIAASSTIKGIKAIKPNLVSLANNHILDHDNQGLQSTLNILHDNEIDYVGAGMNLATASKPYFIEKSGYKIGVYACAEHEFSIATEKTAGANPFDPLESLDQIEELRKSCDYVIILYHGGKEHYRYPTPKLQKVCKKIVQKGADLVICQHSHCIGCYEEHNNSTIVYGQGNFIFDYSESEFWQTSILINLKLNNFNKKIEYIPLVKLGNIIALADENQRVKILNEYEERSAQILQTGFIENEYKKFAMIMVDAYLNALHGNGLVSKIARKVFGKRIIHNKYTKNNLAQIKNYIECEAHNELLLEGLNEKIGR